MLAERLNLLRVSAPLFVDPASGLNDNLNGVERPVDFDILEQNGRMGEVVQSLAKWKRYALKKYGFQVGEGLYTDMSAIRRDEETDNIHSIYVDQWDWEKIIRKEDRNLETLKSVVRDVYRALRMTERYMSIRYDYIEETLPREIYFITTSELEARFPDKTPKEREYIITRAKGAVCLMQIGDKLHNGLPHDGRAPDYDDWQLNADILVYYPVLDIALELSSMGIRVDAKSLAEQLKTLDKTRLKEKIGQLDAVTMRKVDHVLRNSLSLQNPFPCRIVLCSTCSQRMYHTKAFHVKRVSKCPGKKRNCQLCRRKPGMEYEITIRRIEE